MFLVSPDFARAELSPMLSQAQACLDAACDGSDALPDGVVDDLLAARLLVSTALVMIGETMRPVVD